jgi:glucokinase
MANGNKYSIGFDLGGMKMLCVLFDDDFKPVHKIKVKTPPDNDATVVLEAIAGLTAETVKQAGISINDVQCAGIAVPGPVDRNQGIVISTPNMGLVDFPLKRDLESKWGIPVFIENDANAGTYGEFRRGAGRGKKNVAGIFIGTGIGGGIVIDGKLYCGSAGYAGEIGHIIIMEGGPLCGCGQYGCLEAFASRTSMAKDAIAAAVAGNIPAAYKVAGSDFKLYKSKVFDICLKEGDARIQSIVDRAAYHMGIGMANLVNILNPELIVLGGGIADRIGEPYLRAVRKSMEDHLMQGIAKTISVALSELKELAIPIGAACIAVEGAK